jgi:hypothetical protein
MALSIPREGETLEFHSRACVSFQTTIGDAEQLVWSSIKHMSVDEVADRVLAEFHKGTDKRSRKAISKNLKLYVEQAFQFYKAAQAAGGRPRLNMLKRR